MQYKKLFLQTARAKLREFEDTVIILEKDLKDRASIEQLLIILHAFKSDAATMSFVRLANALHSVEEFVIAVRDETVRITGADIDNLFVFIDAVRSDLDHIQKTTTETDLAPKIAFIVRRLSTEVPRIAASVIQQKTTSAEVYAPLSSYVEVPSDQLDATLGFVNDIIAANQQLQRLLARGDTGGVRVGLYNLSSKASNVREAIVSMKMIPVRQYFVFLSRLVRDLARQQKKFITFNFNDNNLRFEKNVLESIREVCVQLIKNSVSHGFREGEKGMLTLAFDFKADTIYVSVVDTGQGIDWDALKSSTHTGPSKKNILKLTPERKNQLLFASHASSSEKASLAAGRGLGLAAVKSIVESMGGSIGYNSIERGRGHGARFDITIPLTPTLFRALTWRWGQYYLALPLFVVEKVIHLDTDISSRVGFSYRGSDIPLFQLEKKLGIMGKIVSSPAAIAVVRWNEKKLGIALPASVSEQELITKGLTSVRHNPLIMGVAVSEESLPVTILNHRNLFEHHDKG